MHQPFYKDLISGEYKLPWTRMHALKDYYGMVQILEEFPNVRQTFNLVPSMMVQVADYAAGKAVDPFLALALKPAENLTRDDRAFLLRHSFYSDPQQMIYRYPRYGELYSAAQVQGASAAVTLGVEDFRDLQMWSQLAWFDEVFKERDPEVRRWLEQGRNFTAADQRRMGEKQREICAQVLPEYRKLAASGQIEISTTPFYHPILPLLCDSDIARVSHPGVPLPPRFRYAGDARLQLRMARDYIEQEFGVAPAGLWPSEGSVSDEVFSIAADIGFRWAATDSGVLNGTLSRPVPVDGLYRPYRWGQRGQSLHVLFRDHYLSDLIGFVYSKMDAAQAAGDFLKRIRENCAGILAAGRDALVPIILDGENAWEYYPRNGRPFLRELYRRISADPSLRAITIGEAMRLLPSEPLDHIFPGSWINANFDVWIGAEEDNQAWAQLLRARETYDASANVPAEKRKLALEELLIAEGSDWCWWYGPEHESPNRPEFDQLFRNHLANVYRFLELTPPEELSRPILRIAVPAVISEPSGPITPVIDGEVTSFFEWMGAARYRTDDRSGSMHAGKAVAAELHYGSDGRDFYLRIDFSPGMEQEISSIEARINLQALDDRAPVSRVAISLAGGAATASSAQLAGPGAIACAYSRVLEISVPLAAIGVASGRGLRFQCSLWQAGLPIEAIPHQGWLELSTTDPDQMAG
jgi:alpha-amylase/alpha-mannosidase (GH57 family)